MFGIPIKRRIYMKGESQRTTDIIDAMDDKVFCLIIDGELTVLDIKFISEYYPRKNSYKLISRDDIIGIEAFIGISVII